MTDLPRKFEFTGPSWQPGSYYVAFMDEVRKDKRIAIRYSSRHSKPQYGPDMIFWQETEETVREKLERGTWIITEVYDEAITPPQYRRPHLSATQFRVALFICPLGSYFRAEMCKCGRVTLKGIHNNLRQ